MTAKLQEFKTKIIELLKKDEEFRYTIAGLIGMEEILRRLDRNEKELVKLREDMKEGFARHGEELKKLWEEVRILREDMYKGFARTDEELKKLREDMREELAFTRRHLDALGARWGLMAEESFREGIRALIEKEFGWKVEKWVRFDSEGFVFKRPATIEIDLAISDGKIILIEIKSHVDDDDVHVFSGKAKFYEKIEGRKPDRLMIVTPYVEESALNVAKECQIEVYTKV